MKCSERRQLRLFAITLSVVISLWLSLFIYSGTDSALIYSGFALPGLLLMVGILSPVRLSGVHRTWLSIAKAINNALITTLLSLIFYLLVTPFAVIRRAFFSDEIREPDAASRIDNSYRHRSKPLPPEDMEVPF